LEVWFQETYGREWNLGLMLGGLLFWTTMYLLASAVCPDLHPSLRLSLYPLKALAVLLCLLASVSALYHPADRFLDAQPRCPSVCSRRVA